MSAWSIWACVPEHTHGSQRTTLRVGSPLPPLHVTEQVVRLVQQMPFLRSSLTSSCLVCSNRVLLCTPGYPWNHDFLSPRQLLELQDYALLSKLRYIFKVYFLFMCVCRHMHIHTHGHQKPGVKCPQVRITGGFEPLEMGAGTDIGSSLQEQQVPLTAQHLSSPL